MPAGQRHAQGPCQLAGLQEVCIPEDAALTLTADQSATAAPDPAVAKDFAAARAALPVASPWKLTYALGTTLDLYVAAPSLAAAHPVSRRFLSRHHRPDQERGAATGGLAKDGLVLRLTPARQGRAASLDGLLVLTSSDGSVQALNVEAPPGPVPAADFARRRQRQRRSHAVAGHGLRLPGRADPECDALRAADPGDEGAGAGAAWRRRPRRKASPMPPARCCQLRRAGPGDRGAARRRRGGGLGLSAAVAHRGGGLCAAGVRGGPEPVGPVRSRQRHGGREPDAARAAVPAPSSPACWRWRWPRPAPRPSWRRRWALP